MSCRRSSMTLLHDDFSAGERRKENNSFEVGVVTEKTYWSVALFVLALFTLLFTSRVHSSGIPNDPILRMEMGMHSAWITSIGIDAQNQFIVTGSQDKTVRLWELSTGRLLTILRLAYSKDGRFLVVGMEKKGGIRIYNTSDYSIAGEDRDYGDAIYGVDFDGSGRLVIVSKDGFIRLYGSDFKLITKRKAPDGFRPARVRFSPDGSSIAVTFFDDPMLKGKLDVLSGKDLSHQYSPDIRGIAKGFFGSVCWSLDGKFFYAGKGPWVPFIIRKWKEGGKGEYKDFAAAEHYLTDLLPLTDGGVAFSSAFPSFGIFDTNDKKIVDVSPPIADYRWAPKEFLVSKNGDKIKFCYERFGKSPARFSVIERSIKTNPALELDLWPPVTQAPGLNITDWDTTTNPKLNGKPLKFWVDDFSRSLAISPEKDTFLIGSKFFLYLFDRQGNHKWVVRLPGETFAVNISPDGRFALAALGDGTLRWYRMQDGKELLALFPHRDKKRWVLWTPSGYYDASPGAEELIGWHVNNGPDQAADFFPSSKFRAAYYRPDVVAKILETLDETEAVRIANEESGKKSKEVSVTKILPPVVNILSPKDGSETSAEEIEG